MAQERCEGNFLLAAKRLREQSLFLAVIEQGENTLSSLNVELGAVKSRLLGHISEAYFKEHLI